MVSPESSGNLLYPNKGKSNRDSPMVNQIAYHYTSLDAFASIVKEQTFRLGNIFFMNDYKEVEWCFDIASALVVQREEEEFDILYNLIQGRGFGHIFCGCFSTKEDDLSQWRGYADDGRGIAMGVDLNAVGAANRAYMLAMEVEYCVEKQKAEVEKILAQFITPAEGDFARFRAKSLEASFAYHQLADLAVQFKNPAFAGEDEVRLVRRIENVEERESIWCFNDILREEFPDDELGFNIRGGRIAPYANIVMPVAAIRRIWLGPRFGEGMANLSMAQAALQLFLSKHGVDEDVVKNLRRSKASYGS